MSRAYPSANREYDPGPDEDREDPDDRHPALTPLVIDLISEGERAELEAAIDAPLTVERFDHESATESNDYNVIRVGNVRAGWTFNTKTELLADLHEDSESGSNAASDAGGNHYD